MTRVSLLTIINHWCHEWFPLPYVRLQVQRVHESNNTVYYRYIIIIIVINKVLGKVTLNIVIAGALYIVCGWNTVKVQGWQLTVNTWQLTKDHIVTTTKMDRA